MRKNLKKLSIILFINQKIEDLFKKSISIKCDKESLAKNECKLMKIEELQIFFEMIKKKIKI